MQEKILPHHHDEEACSEKLIDVLSRIDDFDRMAEIIKQIDDSTRMRVFWLLCHTEECVINIAAIMEMSSPAVSHHLRILKNSGLIESRRKGKEVFYKASDNTVSRLLHTLIEQVMEITCPD